jgi:hypothetical protein
MGPVQLERIHMCRLLVRPLNRSFSLSFLLGVLLAVMAWPAGAAPSIGLVSFAVGDGDLVVVSTNNPPGPWTYDSARGSWSAMDMVDCGTAPRSSRLISPAWSVVSAGTVTLTFTHRHSFEVDTTRWDGGQLRLSVNGGPYTMVPATSFTANGYNNTIGGAAVPTSEIAGQLAFTGESVDYSSEIFITSVARLGTFIAGDTLSVQFLAAWDDCSQGQAPNWEITSLQFTPSLEDRRPPPSFVNAALPADAGVVEGTSHTLQAAVTGQTRLQWFHDNNPIPGATETNYTIVNMSAADAGQYYLRAANAIGSQVSRTANVTLLPDRVPPVLLIAYGDSTDLTRFTLLVSEPVCTDEIVCGTDADDYFNYAIEAVDGSEALDITQITVTDGTNITLFTSATRTPGKVYRISADRGAGIGDIYRNVTPFGPSSQIIVSEPSIFQQGVNGYDGTDDTELRGAAPATPQALSTFVTVDTSDGGAMSQGLLRFGNLFGSAPGQIPPGSIIYSAHLILTHSAAGPDGDVVNVHRMLVPWVESTVTYNSLVAGVSANGVEARTSPDFMIVSAGLAQGGKLTFDATVSIQSWANGEANYGWAMIPTGGNGYRWDTSESTVAGSQPRLEVLFSVPPCAPIAITRQPAATTTINEGAPFTLSVEVTSQGCPPTFQWSRNGTDIPGATDSSYGVASAVPNLHGGTYSVRVANALPSSAVSSPAQVNVISDATKPLVVSAVSEADLVTITVVYSEAVSASAESPGNYSLVAAVGGGPLALSITRVNPTTIRLTSPTRGFGANYLLSISGITDLASTPNTIVPVVVPIVSDSRRLLATDATWKYDEAGNYDSTLAPGATPWYAPGFSDAAWASGQGFFGLETPATIAALPLPNPLIRTPWTISAAQLTYYLRTTINVPSTPGGSVLVLRHATDDGLVAYVDGVEKARYNMPAGQPVLHDQLAPVAIEATVICSALPGVEAGSHTLAVEVHQSATASSDVVFGAELLQLIPPRLVARGNPDGSVTLTWPNSSSWQLVQATTVDGRYAAVAGASGSPFTIATPFGNAFYQLQCR